MLSDKPLSISELNTIVKTVISESFYNISIVGEISQIKKSATNHLYLSLKDDKSLLSCVMFSTSARMLDFNPRCGDLVVAKGSLDVYQARGTYQLIITKMEKSGLGLLQAEFEKKKEYYRSLGYFDQDIKKPIPKYPSRIGIVTATSGAAIQDMLKTTLTQAPSVDIIIYPSLVQGIDAGNSIAKMIQKANELPIVDVLIVGRGGGSAEDLQCFSSDEVVKAIYESEIPIISAVGHETDWTLADYTADLRAITPTEGANIATQYYAKLRNDKDKTISLFKSIIDRKLSNINIVEPRYLHSCISNKLNINVPQINERLINMKIDKLYQTIDHKLSSLDTSIVKIITKSKNSLNIAKNKIDNLNPLSILKRGYSIALDKNGNIIKDISNIKLDDEVNIKLHKGEIKAQVKGVK